MAAPRIKYGVAPCQARGRLLFLRNPACFRSFPFIQAGKGGGLWGRNGRVLGADSVVLAGRWEDLEKRRLAWIRASR